MLLIIDLDILLNLAILRTLLELMKDGVNAIVGIHNHKVVTYPARKLTNLLADKLEEVMVTIIIVKLVVKMVLDKHLNIVRKKMVTITNIVLANVQDQLH